MVWLKESVYNSHMARLLLIRHSVPEQDSSIPANQWRLSHAGREACKDLAEALKPYTPTILVSSMEPKAIETAQLVRRQLGIPAEIAAGLHEHDRSNVPYLPSQQSFNDQIKAMYDRPGERVFGLESADQAHARYAAAVNTLIENYPGETLGIVSHGTVMSLFIGRANPVDPYEFWQILEMPDFAVLELPGLILKERV
jgi:broad specificity phosphatase PhoE